MRALRCECSYCVCGDAAPGPRAASARLSCGRIARAFGFDPIRSVSSVSGGTWTWTWTWPPRAAPHPREDPRRSTVACARSVPQGASAGPDERRRPAYRLTSHINPTAEAIVRPLYVRTAYLPGHHVMLTQKGQS